MMKVNAKFFCNHCGSIFDAKDADKPNLRCPICDGYKVSLQMDLWNEPEPEEFRVEIPRIMLPDVDS